MVRKKHAAKRRTLRRRTRTSRPIKKRGVKTPFRRTFKKKTAKTKTGRLWKYVKRVTKKEKGRKDLLVTDNPTYSNGTIRAHFGITVDQQYPYRYLSSYKTRQWFSKVGAGQIQQPIITFSASDSSSIQNMVQGEFGYFTGLMLYPYPKKGTLKNQITGDEFFLDSLNFTFTCHRRVGKVDSTSNTNLPYFRGGSISFYLIIEPIGSINSTSFTSDNLYSQIFDNTQNWNNYNVQPGATSQSGLASDDIVDGLRRDYYNKKRNLLLSKSVRIIRLFRLDYSTNAMAVTKFAGSAISEGTGPIAGTAVESNGAPILFRYDASSDWVKAFKVCVKVKKKLFCNGPVNAITADQKTDYLSNLAKPVLGTSYNFWLLPCTSFLSEFNQSWITVETRGEAIFHDV